MIKLYKRNGMHNIYQTEFGFLWIGRCTNPNVYQETGYYIECNKLTKDNEICKIAYKTSKQAINAYVKFMKGL